MENYIPTNEQGVIYYFSKHHKELGFEKILHFTTHFPDVTVLKDGDPYRIELEFRLSTIEDHYKAIDKGYWGNVFRWREDKKMWWTFDETKNDWVEWFDYKIYDKDKYCVDRLGNLRYKTLSDQCDCVLFWINDYELDDNLDLINLQDFLLNKVW